MATPLSLGAPHHIRLTVTDVARSQEFYTGVLGFEVAVGGPPPEDDPQHDAVVETLQGGIIMSNGSLMVGLRPVSEEYAEDRFSPFRVGLDHVCFSVPARSDLEAAAQALEDRGVEHGEVRDLPALGMAFLAVFDPDGIALELTAPLG